MTEHLPVEERIEILTKRLYALNNNLLLDIEERLEEIKLAREALTSALMEKSRGR